MDNVLDGGEKETFPIKEKKSKNSNLHKKLSQKNLTLKISQEWYF